MAWKKALYYGAIAIAILIAVSIIVSIVSALLSLAWTVISAAVSLAILAALIYAVYKIGSWLLGGDGGASADEFGTSRTSTTSKTVDPQEKLRRDYVEGRISEAEFERRIGEELETESLSRDLNLERER
ncbi:hypothetical protein [Halorubrum vacuolatum]|uniref:Short C-terminal domain-containing protein n=1 Tax=Halorubrum vacuolatum TaxID=63740 RepID=A0A238X448_HALVU|nr:hypothetical protein [Halorubrum vacuolatum]SNR53707.1 hypothetical protein SAMN06264855_11349 [Halorubrum vacuolatum]